MTTNFDTITETAENVTELIRVTEDALTETKRQRNPDLTPEANDRQAGERQEQIRADALTWITQKSAAAELATTKAEQALKKIRPSVDEGNAADLVRAEQRWNHQVKPILDAGQPLKEVLRTASVDDLLAIERFAGGWLAAQRLTANNPLEIEPADLEQAILNRMVKALPEDQQGAFEDAVRAQRAGQVFKEVRELAVQAVGGQSHNALSNWGHAKTKVSRLR